MAAHGTQEYGTAEGNDLPMHEATYDKFVSFATVGVLHVINLTLGLAIGGVKGAWWTALGIFFLAIVTVIHGLVTGAKAPSAVVLVIGLAALALA
jgi:hypothetical protein